MTRFRRVAYSLDVLADEVNARWPHRSKASDGTLGDPAHAARASDHNPNVYGVVRARDITAAGIDPGWLAEHIRTLGADGHPPLQNHGYVIFNGRAAYATNGWKWKKYTGPNAHTHHIHTSVGREPAQYDDRTPWGIAKAAIPGPPPKPVPPKPPKQEIDDMIVQVTESGSLWACTAVSRRNVTKDEADLLVFNGFARYDAKGQPFKKARAVVELLPKVES